jgi:hypothetical protein
MNTTQAEHNTIPAPDALNTWISVIKSAEHTEALFGSALTEFLARLNPDGGDVTRDELKTYFENRKTQAEQAADQARRDSEAAFARAAKHMRFDDDGLVLLSRDGDEEDRRMGQHLAVVAKNHALDVALNEGALQGLSYDYDLDNELNFNFNSVPIATLKSWLGVPAL